MSEWLVVKNGRSDSRLSRTCDSGMKSTLPVMTLLSNWHVSAAVLRSE